LEQKHGGNKEFVVITQPTLLQHMNIKRPVLTFIDRLKLRHLFFAAFLLTVVFAISYFEISLANEKNGLKAIDLDGNPKSVEFSDALYFSIVTEATLGYGDIRPVGVSRLLACLQVGLGLLLAGLFVAKITSGRDRKMRIASINSAGYWLEIFKTPKNEMAVAFVKMYYDGDNLHYDGTNYNLFGISIEDFTGTLISVENNILTFYFSNVRNNLFNNGISIVAFKSDGTTEKWDYYDADLFDIVDNGRKTNFYGVRANEEQAKIMLSTKTDRKKALIENIIQLWTNELRERNIIS